MRHNRRYRHAEQIRGYLHVKKYHPKNVDHFALDFAKTREKLEDILNCIVEEMILQNMEFPKFSALKSVSEKARPSANRYYYQYVFHRISSEQISAINQYLLNKEQQDASQSI